MMEILALCVGIAIGFLIRASFERNYTEVDERLEELSKPFEKAVRKRRRRK